MSHVSASDWILSAFIVAVAAWVLLAEMLPGKRSDDPDAGGDERDPGPAVLPVAA